MDIQQKPAFYSILCVFVSGLGVSLCFFWGFPFGNHNESYSWLTEFSQKDLGQILTQRLASAATFRPLGNALAWTTFQLSSNIYLQQLVNYCFVIASFIVLLFAAKNKALLSIGLLLNGTIFFSGYIFLFHLHGVFYGPLLLYTSFLISLANNNYSFDKNSKWVKLFILSMVASLFHTFALIFYIAFLSSYLFKSGRALFKEKLVLVAQITTAFLLILAFSKDSTPPPMEKMISGFLLSFQNMELGTVQSLIAMLFSVLVSIRFFNTLRNKILISLLVLLLSFPLIKSNVPISFLWITASLGECFRKKNIILGFLCLASLSFPLTTGTGSPTYLIFTYLICLFITADTFFGAASPASEKKILLPLAISGYLLFLGLMLGFHVPLLYAAIKPIRDEKEKTYQLENIIRWKLHSEKYTGYYLQLNSDLRNTARSKNTATRRNDAPTSQVYLDNYIRNQSGSLPRGKILYVNFNEAVPDNRKTVYTVQGSFNGNAYVFE